MKPTLHIVLTTSILFTACSPKFTAHSAREREDHTDKPSAQPGDEATTPLVVPRNPSRASEIDPSGLIPHRVRVAIPEQIFTTKEIEQIRIKQEQEKTLLDKRVADDIAKLQAKRAQFEEEERRFQAEAAAAAEKLDAASKGRLEKMTKDLVDAMAVHKKALCDTQSLSKETAKEAAAATKQKLEQTLKKARDQLEQLRQEMQTEQKKLFDTVLDAAAKVAAIG